MEQLWFEVPGRNKHSKALIGVIYRSERIQSSSDWLDSFESLLGHLTVSWDGLLLVTGDINIDLLKPNDPLSKTYQSILEIFGLTQHVTKPTRVTQNLKTLIDHIVTNDPHCVAATGIIPAPTISDHDAVFACVNVRVRRFQPRYKWIRLERKFVTEEFLQDSANLPFSVIYGLESPDDMVNALNTLFSECIERHAPLKRIKLTRPPAPWMNANEIRKLQADRDRLRFEAHKTNSDDSWKAFREVRNKIKSVINKTKRNFIKTALSSNRPKEVWRMIHRILHPNKRPLHADPDKLNDYFIKTNERTLGTKPAALSYLLEFIDSLSDGTTPQQSFSLRPVSHREVLCEIDKLRSDTSTGTDNIPVKFVKLAREHLPGPLQYIINHCIARSAFPEAWKIARISPIPKIDQPLCEADYRPV
jgi:hypothetical protein